VVLDLSWSVHPFTDDTADGFFGICTPVRNVVLRQIYNSQTCEIAIAYTRTSLVAPSLTRSLAVAKRPCDCCVGQFWPDVTGRRYFADIIALSSTTETNHSALLSDRSIT